MEALISEVEGVEMVAVLPKPDERWGERPLAVVKGKAGKEDILKYLEQKVEEGVIAKWWIPDDVIYVDEMP